MHSFSRLVPQGLASLALGGLVACSPLTPTDKHEGSVSSEKANQVLTDLDTAQVSLAGVKQIALTDDLRMAFVAGEFANSHDVIGAFAQGSVVHLERENIDKLGFSHQTFSQTLNGLPVVGGNIRVARNPVGDVIAASGISVRPDDIASPKLSAASVKDSVLAASPGADRIDNGSLVYVAGSNLSPTLAWQFDVRGLSDDGSLPRVDKVFVNAVDGEIVARHADIHTARDRDTYTASNTQDTFTLLREEGDGAIGDAEVDTTHDAAGETYDCLQAIFGRDSFDNAGATINGVAHYGNNVFNAFWDPGNQAMFYGEGFAEREVGYHEIGHAVTTFTANLIYQNESGALNEGSSDILAVICDVMVEGAIDANTWLLAEDLSVGNFDGPIRWLNDPTIDGFSTDHYTTRYTGTDDQGGVHWNSGIYNLYFFLLVEGGVHPRRAGEQEVEAAGIDAAQQIHFRALSMYMNQSTNFAAARIAHEQAATDLFDAGSDELISVQEAWYAVGVGGPPDVRAPVCGDDDIEGDETCDDGNTDNGDGCDSTCTIEPDPVCGDGSINTADETCDDGNTADGDGCSATCITEEPEPEPTPGDGDGGGCSTTPSAPIGPGWLLLLGALGFIARRRRN